MNRHCKNQIKACFISSTKEQSHSVQGFTLIEVLIALFIVALISPIIYQSATLGSESLDRLKTKYSELEQIKKTIWLMENDFFQAIPRPVIVETQNKDAALKLEQIANDSVIEFTRINSNITSLQRHGLQRVRYFVQDGQLIRRFWLDVDRTKATEYYDKVVLNEVEAFTIVAKNSQNKDFNIWPDDSFNSQASVTSASLTTSSTINNYHDIIKKLPASLQVKIKLSNNPEIKKTFLLVDNFF